MRIALAWISHDPLTAITVRYERYVQGLEALGHDVITVCTKSTSVGYAYPTLEVERIESFLSAEFWRSLNVEVVLVVSWISFPDIMEAIKAAGPTVIAIADSDGVIGTRAHPWEVLRRMVVQHPTLRTKLGAWKHWCQLFLYQYRTSDETCLRSASASDRIVVNSPGARDNLRKFFLGHRRAELCERIVVVPYPVDAEFLLPPEPPPATHNRIVAVGRWDDPQKDAELLRRGLKAVIPRLPATQFLIIGRNGETPFGELCRRHPNVQYVGVQTPARIAELLRESRSLLVTSRWESGPIVVNEALCVGCSLIGPRWIPTIEWYSHAGPYGTTFNRRSPMRLADALVAEMDAWEGGQRNKPAIAAHFHDHFTPKSVCEKLLDISQVESNRLQPSRTS